MDLRIVQQPQRGLAAGLELRLLGRLPIQPPPVLQLVVTEDGRGLDPEEISESNILICSASLIGSNGNEDLDFLPQQQQQRQALVGRLVSDIKQTITESDGEAVAYFVFGDLSVRVAGRYRLKFVLAAAQPGSSTLAEVVSDEFEVLESQQFTQLSPTALTRHLVSENVFPASLL